MKLVDKFFKAYGSTLTFRLVKGFRLQRNFLDLTNFFFFFSKHVLFQKCFLPITTVLFLHK